MIQKGAEESKHRNTYRLTAIFESLKVMLRSWDFISQKAKQRETAQENSKITLINDCALCLKAMTSLNRIVTCELEIFVMESKDVG